MVILKVPKMNCDGCAATVEKAVRTVDAAAGVDIDLASKRVTIDTQVEATRISEAVKAAGYENEASPSP